MMEVILSCAGPFRYAKCNDANQLHAFLFSQMALMLIQMQWNPFK